MRLGSTEGGGSTAGGRGGQGLVITRVVDGSCVLLLVAGDGLLLVTGRLLGALLFLAALLGCLRAVGPASPLRCCALEKHSLLGQSLEGLKLARREVGKVELLVRVGAELEHVEVEGPEPVLVALHLRAPGQLPAGAGIEVRLRSLTSSWLLLWMA